VRELSVVVPLHNEEGNVVELHREIKEVCRKAGYRYEIVFVDDGSSDGTARLCQGLAPLVYLKLRRNFGQTAALDAGIRQARYPLIVTMDGDRQNDPADIPAMVDYLERNGLDVVSGWRRKRRDPFFKRLYSRGANLLRHVIVHDGIHDSGCGLKVYRKECFEQIALYGEMHRFIPALLKIKGFKIGELVVNHRPREAGITKYNWKRTIRGFIDMISVWFWNRYAVRPLHLLGGIGMLFMVLGLACALLTIVIFLLRQDLSNTVWPLLSAFLVIMGIQLFVFGLVGDILSRTYYQTTRDRSYNIELVRTNEEGKRPAPRRRKSPDSKP
jgi:glycosyltransferase involved in cell wall biosynthesis